jgi:hypothetical protein
MKTPTPRWCSFGAKILRLLTLRQNECPGRLQHPGAFCQPCMRRRCTAHGDQNCSAIVNNFLTASGAVPSWCVSKGRTFGPPRGAAAALFVFRQRGRVIRNGQGLPHDPTTFDRYVGSTAVVASHATTSRHPARMGAASQLTWSRPCRHGRVPSWFALRVTRP